MEPSAFGVAPPERESARLAVSGPAIFLIVVAAIGAALNFTELLGEITGFTDALRNQLMAFALDMARQSGSDVSNLETALAAPRSVFSKYGVPLFGLLVDAFVIMAGLRMRKLQSLGMARGACILALFPCTYCCCVTLPAGIWGLVVLSKDYVRDSFTS